jgi:hypothetical protein
MGIMMPKEKVEVGSYSGYRGEETPRTFQRGGARVEVAEIRNRWIEEGIGDRETKRGFSLIGTDGVGYCLIYHERTKEWFCEWQREP